jgi:hypothetical protein
MGTKMYSGADASDIIMRAFIHRCDLFKFQRWVSGPDGKVWRNGEGNIIDGHDKLLICLALSATQSKRAPLSANSYGVGVSVFDGLRLAVDARVGIDIGVNVGVIVGVGVGRNGIQPL